MWAKANCRSFRFLAGGGPFPDRGLFLLPTPSPLIVFPLGGSLFFFSGLRVPLAYPPVPVPFPRRESIFRKDPGPVPDLRRGFPEFLPFPRSGFPHPIGPQAGVLRTLSLAWGYGRTEGDDMAERKYPFRLSDDAGADHDTDNCWRTTPPNGCPMKPHFPFERVKDLGGPSPLRPGANLVDSGDTRTNQNRPRDGGPSGPEGVSTRARKYISLSTYSSAATYSGGYYSAALYDWIKALGLDAIGAASERHQHPTPAESAEIRKARTALDHERNRGGPSIGNSSSLENAPSATEGGVPSGRKGQERLAGDNRTQAGFGNPAQATPLKASGSGPLYFGSSFLSGNCPSNNSKRTIDRSAPHRLHADLERGIGQAWSCSPCSWENLQLDGTFAMVDVFHDAGRVHLQGSAGSRSFRTRNLFLRLAEAVLASRFSGVRPARFLRFDRPASRMANPPSESLSNDTV